MFKHHKLLIWMVAEEYSEALTKAEVSQVAARIKRLELFDHVVGVHQLSGNMFDFVDDPNIDMFMMQLNESSAASLHALVSGSNANGLKILDMAEAANHAKQTREIVRKWNWASIMGGASAVQVLGMGRASDPAQWNSQEKYDDCARLMDFMELLRLNETRCRDDLARGDTDYVLANPGHVYIVYADGASSLGVNVEAGVYMAVWYDPVDSDWFNEGIVALGGGDQYFAKPVSVGDEAVLYLEAFA
jgi:hypothetical protein